ncbi:hexosaminidase [Chitinophaga costaii]|uniref:beta-N-acetylhexosaminidase n=1 Tax=Chitinophaga costaii TaxID=1335309 RepID=A0A1C4G140_9BACT|nr:family 20 glycosylhydrolase [Chitinophaga costaii]PUZ19945.1 beta-N-acetylhexosaminidase [Chitinophaga costaii]SCC61842.1 hexosaminidase [Chitinophaga costaii]
MFRHKFLLTALLGITSQGFAQSSQPLDAARLQLHWEVVENHHEGKDEVLSAITLINKSKKPLPASGWQLYFNFDRPITPGSLPAHLVASHVNGDVYKLAPEAGFQQVLPGDSVRMEFLAGAWTINFTDAPSGFFIVWDQQPDKGYAIRDFSIRPSVLPKQLLSGPQDKTGVLTAADIYAQNAGIQDLAAEKLPKIFPTPTHYIENNNPFLLDKNTSIQADADFAAQASTLAAELGTLLGKAPAVGGSGSHVIALHKINAPHEAYTLNVTPGGISIGAGDEAGVFYGIQSLKNLIPAAYWKAVQKSIPIAGVTVSDTPRFAYRGFMLDVARNFHQKEEVERVLDVMALYKLNVFHFHLSDDEGWRLEIPGLPELTAIGGKRGYAPDPTDAPMLLPSYGSGPDTTQAAGSGYFSRADFIAILQYAKARHIRVIPEIEAPGHARAAVYSMTQRYRKLLAADDIAGAHKYLLADPDDQSIYHSVQFWNDNVINVALPSTYTFLEKVVDEIKAMYNEAGAELSSIHMGGDEVPAGVWQKSPACLALMQQDSLKSTQDLWYYFYGRVNKILQQRGLQLYGWEEVGMRKTTRMNGEDLNIPNPDFVNSRMHLVVWNNVIGGGAEDLAYRLANAGYKIVLGGVSNFYFDMAYTKTFAEPGYYWGGYVDVDKPFYFIPFNYYKNATVDAQNNPVGAETFLGKDGLTAYGASNIEGLEGLLWSENITSDKRLEYMLLPKLLALAERAWAPDPAWAQEADSTRRAQLYSEAWSVFANVLGKRELPRLDVYNKGYNYRIPPVGVSTVQGLTSANVQFPGLQIRYTTDGSTPTAKSSLYTSPLPANPRLQFKAFSSNGRTELENAPVKILPSPATPSVEGAPLP